MTATTQFQAITHKRAFPLAFGLALGAGITALAFTLTPGAPLQTGMLAQAAGAATGARSALGTAYDDDAPNVAGWVPPTGAFAPGASRPAMTEYADDDAPNVVGWVPQTGDVSSVAARASVNEYDEAAPAVSGWEPRHSAKGYGTAVSEHQDDAPNVTAWAPRYNSSNAEPQRHGATAAEARYIGRAWVGSEAQATGAGFETSADGLRQYRDPRYNPVTGFIQADLLSRDEIGEDWVGRSHIEITGIYFDGE